MTSSSHYTLWYSLGVITDSKAEYNPREQAVFLNIHAQTPEEAMIKLIRNASVVLAASEATANGVGDSDWSVRANQLYDSFVK